jgi:rhodanese-related sulfurtransferase
MNIKTKEDFIMKEMTAKEVEILVNEGKTLNIIDVREVDEVTEGKIPGAVNIPLGLVEPRMDELDKSKEYIMVCRSGGRSGRATQFLEKWGYDVTNMQGGMLDWEGKVE